MKCDDLDLNHCMEYVVINPVQIGLKEWKWVEVKREFNERGTGVPPVCNMGR